MYFFSIPCFNRIPAPQDFIHLFLIWLWLDVEKITEKIEMGLNPQKRFTEMNKDGDVKNRVGVEVIELKVVIKPEVGRANPHSTKY
jgi:hypothetical protein